MAGQNIAQEMRNEALGLGRLDYLKPPPKEESKDPPGGRKRKR